MAKKKPVKKSAASKNTEKAKKSLSTVSKKPAKKEARKEYLSELMKVFQREKPLLIVISGGHAYGFAQLAGNVDVRGCHISPTSDLLSINKPTMTIEREIATKIKGKDVRLGLLSNEVEKFIMQLLEGNGTALEELYSPIQVKITPEGKELQSLGKGCITKRCYYHYTGFGRNALGRLRTRMYRDLREILFIYRIYLTGLNLLETGEVVVDLNWLSDKYACTLPKELISAVDKGKTQPQTFEPDPLQIRSVESDVERLKSLMDESLGKTKIPDTPDEKTIKRLNEFLLKLRKRNWK